MSAATEYVVLVVDRVATGHDGDYTTWREHSAVTASSASQAINIATKDGSEGTFAAVPARSWKPVKVTTEKITKRLFEAV